MDGDGGGWGTNFDDRMNAGDKRFQTPQERFDDELNIFVNSNAGMTQIAGEVKSLFPYIPRHYYYNPSLLFIAFYFLNENDFVLAEKPFSEFFDSYEFYALKLQKTKKRSKEKIHLGSKPDFLRYIRLVQKALSSKKR